eukprot:84337-Rhodomonas_salina.2
MGMNISEVSTKIRTGIRAVKYALSNGHTREVRPEPGRRYASGKYGRKYAQAIRAKTRAHA